MSHGKNASNHHGKEWWGKRPLAGVSASSKHIKWWKRLLHKMERKQGKQEATND